MDSLWLIQLLMLTYVQHIFEESKGACTRIEKALYGINPLQCKCSLDWFYDLLIFFSVSVAHYLEPEAELLYFSHCIVTHLCVICNGFQEWWSWYETGKLLTVHYKRSESHSFTQGTLCYHFILASIFRGAPKDIEFYIWAKIGSG